MKRKINFAVILFILTSFIFVNGISASAKDLALEKQAEVVNKNSETLSLINTYQDKYFTIIKRNNLLINYEDDTGLKKDRKELKKLYKEITKKITNKEYLNKYKAIEKRYAKCDEITTVGINEFAQNNYNEVDSLLNEVYKNIKSKIKADDFKKLTVSERKWLKELENYKKVYDSMSFGTIGTMVYYDYQIDMRKFRTLLLMLYL